MSFLEYYASKFDFKNERIIMTDGGYLSQKREDDTYFSLISPQDPTHDLGSAAYKNYIYNSFLSIILIVSNSEMCSRLSKIGIFF